MLSPIERKRLLQRVSVDNNRLVEVFEALGDANRCKLFRLIHKQPGINVTEAAGVLGLSVPLVSQHMKTLLNHSMLTRQKQGRQVFYKLNSNDTMVRAIVAVITEN